MTDHRWTIDDDGLVRWRDLHAVAALNEDNDDCFEAYDALVAAVRDAARIPQLETERDALRLRFAGLVEGVLSFAEAETNAIIAAGLRAMVENDDDIRDYLPSPAVPDTPTPT